jgi:hypothetical protein
MKGEVLVLLSGDVRLPTERFINNLASRCNHNGAGIVGCRPVPVNDISTRGGYIAHLMWNLHHKTLMAQISNGLWKQAGEGFAIKREATEKIPLNVINDDAYLVLRAQLNGYKFSYARELAIRNKAPQRLRDVLMQRARILKGHRQLKEMIGVSPNVLDMLVFRRPLIVFDVVARELKGQLEKGSFKMHWFIQLLLVELAAHVLSQVGGSSPIWATAHSARWSEGESEKVCPPIPVVSAS